MFKLLLEDNERVETINIEYNGNNYTFDCKILNSGQLKELEKIERKNFKININDKKDFSFPIDAAELSSNQAEVIYKAIHYSIGIAEKEIRKLNNDIVMQLFEHIIRISNITEKDLMIVQNFRQNS